MKGRLIVLEGIDGCGKSTVAKTLKEKSRNAVIVSFPTQDAKRLVSELEGAPVMSSILFYINDMVGTLHDTIAPALREGKTVILDRFWPSTCVYQGERICRHIKDMHMHAALVATTIESVKRMMWLAVTEALYDVNVKPELFVLTLPFREAMLRALKRGENPDQYEQDIDKVWEFRSMLYECIDFDEDCKRISVLGKTPEQIADEIAV